MKLAYGITVQDEEDPFVSLIEHANDNFNIATTPGNVVDILNQNSANCRLGRRKIHGRCLPPAALRTSLGSGRRFSNPG